MITKFRKKETSPNFSIRLKNYIHEKYRWKRVPLYLWIKTNEHSWEKKHKIGFKSLELALHICGKVNDSFSSSLTKHCSTDVILVAGHHHSTGNSSILALLERVQVLTRSYLFHCNYTIDVARSISISFHPSTDPSVPIYQHCVEDEECD